MSPTRPRVTNTVADVLERLGRLDILVNNAGITRDQLVLRMKRDDWDAVLATNLTAAFTCAQAVLKPMIKQRSGRIINITSVVGQAGNAGQANYAASKAGLIGLTKALALEVASRNITVNAVAPGLIDTDMTRALSGGVHEEWAERIPLKRLGTPDDVAAAVAVPGVGRGSRILRGTCSPSTAACICRTELWRELARVQDRALARRVARLVRRRTEWRLRIRSRRSLSSSWASMKKK